MPHAVKLFTVAAVLAPVEAGRLLGATNAAWWRDYAPRTVAVVAVRLTDTRDDRPTEARVTYVEDPAGYAGPQYHAVDFHGFDRPARAA